MKTKKDFLNEIKESCLREIVRLEIDIEIMSNFPPDEIIGSRKLSPDSSEELSAEKIIRLKLKELGNWTQKLTAVANLLKK